MMSAPRTCDFDFFGSVTELTATEIDKLTELDHRHEIAFIVLDEDTGHMLGLVRLIDELEEKTAQFAILVRSLLKGHGLGWLLMCRVIDYAKQKGLRHIFGDVLVENTTMLQIPTQSRIGHQACCARPRKNRFPVSGILLT